MNEVKKDYRAYMAALRRGMYTSKDVLNMYQIVEKYWDEYEQRQDKRMAFMTWLRDKGNKK